MYIIAMKQRNTNVTYQILYLIVNLKNEETFIQYSDHMFTVTSNYEILTRLMYGEVISCPISINVPYFSSTEIIFLKGSSVFSIINNYL